jgi:hypothetical protein
MPLLAVAFAIAFIMHHWAHVVGTVCLSFVFLYGKEFQAVATLGWWLCQRGK